MDLSRKITILRKRRGWSQEQLSLKLEVSRQAVYKWEAGISQPEIDKLKKMAKLFEVSFDELLNDEQSVVWGDQQDAVASPAPVQEEAKEDKVEEKGTAPIIINVENIGAEKSKSGEKGSRGGWIAFWITVGVIALALSVLGVVLIGQYIGQEDFGTENTSSSSSSGTEKVFYTVTFITGNGTAIESLRIENGGLIKANIYTEYDGYELLGWVNMETYEEWDFEKDRVYSNVVLYAVWRKTEYITVTFDKNDGSGTVEKIYVDPGERFTAVDYYSTYDKTVLGYSTTAHGGVEYSIYDEISLRESTTLYAVWASSDIYYVEYHKNDGSGEVYREYVNRGYEHFLRSPFDTRGLIGWSAAPSGELKYGVGQALNYSVNTVLYAVWVDEQGMYFLDNGDGTCTLYAYEGEEPVLVIPNYVDDKRVTGVSDYAFCRTSNNQTLRALWLPTSMTKISVNTLYGCSGLTALVIPGGVREIENGAFSFLASLCDIQVASNNGFYTSVDGVLFNLEKTNLVAYPRGRQDSIYTVPSGTHIIGHSSFFGCTSLEEVYFPDGVGVIRTSAFEGCTSLRKIDIGNRVDYIDGRAFYDCHSLEKITLEHDLLAIGKEAFYNCWSLTSVEIWGDVGEISYRTFGNCTSLESVILGGEITNRVDDNAFYNCPLFKGIAGAE